MLTDEHPVLKHCYCMIQRSPPSFFYARLNTYTNTWHSPLAVDATQSQNDASMIDSPGHTIGRQSATSLVQPIARKPVKRWNFRKAISELFTAETERRTPGLPNPQADDATYTVYCNMLICAAKNNIPRGFNKHYMGRQLQPPPSRAPAGYHQGRHRHNNNITIT